MEPEIDLLAALRTRLYEDGVITFSVKARPGAHKTELRDVLEDGTIKVNVAAAPEDGKANAELVDFLAEGLGIPKDHVEIRAGQTSPRKTIRITM